MSELDVPTANEMEDKVATFVPINKTCCHMFVSFYSPEKTWQECKCETMDYKYSKPQTLTVEQTAANKIAVG